MTTGGASERIARWLPTIAAAVCLACVLYVGSGLTSIQATLTEIAHMADEPDELETSWLGADGLNHKVTTKVRAGETSPAAAERHQAEVNAMLLLFPKAS